MKIIFRWFTQNKSLVVCLGYEWFFVTVFKTALRGSLYCGVFAQCTDSNYSLWKVTKKIKQTIKPSPPLRTTQGTWARNPAEKAQAFANHLMQIFCRTCPSPPRWNRRTRLNPRKPLPTRTTNQPPQKNQSPISHQQLTSQEISRIRPNHWQHPQRTAHHWNSIPNFS
jgi:hypothetical protein